MFLNGQLFVVINLFAMSFTVDFSEQEDPC